jgi:hypothetical protein
LFMGFSSVFQKVAKSEIVSTVQANKVIAHYGSKQKTAPVKRWRVVQGLSNAGGYYRDIRPKQNMADAVYFAAGLFGFVVYGNERGRAGPG